MLSSNYSNPNQRDYRYYFLTKKRNRHYQRLAIELGVIGVREYIIRSALRRAVYKRYVTLRKSLILEYPPAPP